MNEVNIKNLFYGLQKQMQQKLSLNREFIIHPGSKGDSLELNWINLLRDYLPQRYSVDSAFIIDCKNKISDQIDIVIYDRQYSPFVFNQDDVKYIPAESVYAVFEVKQDISKEYINYAGHKAESVRALTRTSAPIYHAGGCYPPKPLNNILAGILTLSSTWTPALGDSFRNNILELKGNQLLNLGCILDSGSFKFADSKLIISTEEESLIFFFLNLLIELQKLGTIPAMEISSYASALDSI
jgi:hypothetical protein